ncbi:spore germination protein [Alicyclobacillus sp. ALC3]|uniref:spore germination protein n=1 Tax=Alicyclobacillus sp. ALC3 TaxID=2796143 RepID=UPI002379E356|nr:spore germination protein [Alicyclobacillus sp. ALC3]WDL97868.1 spore germination protein [Alicyclobacillus sp. ALC3]
MRLESVWENCDDLEYRSLEVACGRLLIVWLKPLVGKDIAQAGIIEPLSRAVSELVSMQDVRRRIWSPTIHAHRTWSATDSALAEGNMMVFVDGSAEVLGVDVNAFQARPIGKAEAEPSVIGPQNAFVEDVDKNIGLIRTIVKTPQFKVELHVVGQLSQTKVAVCYLGNLCKPELVTEVRARLGRVKLDGVLDLNMIRESTNDAPFSLFPLDQTTERPDRVAAALLQARIAILCDGSPAAMMLPATFMNHLQSHEDYYLNFVAAGMVRVLRHVMYWSSFLLPALFVSIVAYHPQMVPTQLLVSLAASHEGVPFPSAIEALIMVLIFEALREAGIRLPKAVGQSVSIVGALVLGQAAVAAGLVSPAMVIVVALSGVASFTIPNYALSYTNRLLSIVFLLLASVFGLLGVSIGMFILLTHLVSLRSYGVPYLAPIAPLEWKSLLRDTFFRAPWWNMQSRPALMEPQQSARERTPRPGPESGRR